MESFMFNANNLCDTVFLIGEEKTEMRGVKALLANISPVFRAQFFGNFMSFLIIFQSCLQQKLITHHFDVLIGFFATT